MRRLLAAIAITASFAGLYDAQAQTFPSRPLTIVVPFPAGGPTDALARILANRMKEALGQSVVVENPTGAAGTIGTGRVARAVPDGYTLILGHWQTHVVNGATSTLPFDVVQDFEPISLGARCPGAPDTPTIDEGGVPGLHASFWHGLWAPKGTPKDVIATLHGAVVETLADPSVRRRFADVGQEVWPRDKQTPQALAAQQQAEIEKWWPIIKAANIRAE